ncbi:protein TMED8 [Protopterus annectens]|uniref:protein TMED8 n=1 Tax=Protopterus annectens TaxID=7888 RepID=UPI001CF9A181|nr:protein TMED8 [Protopterus annectens]
MSVSPVSASSTAVSSGASRTEEPDTGQALRIPAAEGNMVQNSSEGVAELAELSISEISKQKEDQRPQSFPLLNVSSAGNSGSDDGILRDRKLNRQSDQPSSPQQIKTTASAPLPVQNVSSDSVALQSDNGGTSVLSVEALPSILDNGPQVHIPAFTPPSTWTSPKIAEFKSKMKQEKNAVTTVSRGDVLTMRVPTHPDGKRLCWEFATDGYDIGFGIYFDWIPVTSTAITFHISESSDEEDEEDIEGPQPPGDVERGSKHSPRSQYSEILPVYRKDSHVEVQAGSHEYPGEGVYLLKFDNSYSLLRNKKLYYHVYYTA